MKNGTYDFRTSITWNDIALDVEGRYVYEKETPWEPSHIDIIDIEFLIDGDVIDEIMDDIIRDKMISMIYDKIQLKDIEYIGDDYDPFD
mgnify:CR=1 FL=1